MQLKDFEAEVKAVFGHIRKYGITSTNVFRAEVFLTSRVATIELCEIGINIWSAWEVRHGQHTAAHMCTNKTSVNEALTELKTLLESGQPAAAVQKGANMASHVRRRKRSRSGQLTLAWFRQLAESIFDAVIDTREKTLANLPCFQADVVVSGKQISVNLQRETGSKYNAWVPATMLSTQAMISGSPTPRVALGKLKRLLESRIAGSSSSQPGQMVGPVKPIIPPRTSAKFKVMPLNRSQCRDIAEKVFDVQFVEQVTGKDTAFRITVIMFDPTTIELDTDTDGRWIAHEPISNKIAHDEKGSKSPLQVLKDLKKKLMA